MSASKGKRVMNARRRTLTFAVAALVLASVAGPGCWAKDPCGEGLVFVVSKSTCVAAIVADAAPEAASKAEAGADAGEAGADGEAMGPPEAAAPSNFGKPCAAMTDCGGDAPICPAPQLPYCTQIHCLPGEANAGSCPAGYTCFTVPGYPSGCLRD